MNYLFVFIALSFFIVNCNQSEKKNVTKTYTAPEKPTVHSRIDSVKYKAEIYRLDTLFQRMYNHNMFNGNVLIAKSNHIIYQKSFGYRVKEKNQLLNDTTLFQLASVSKVITSIGVLLLYEQGKLKLDQSVTDFLPEFPFKNITIRNLLSHRSGIPNYPYFCDQLLKNQTTVLCNQDILDIMIKHEPKCYLKPNTRFNYSNTNYALLALIIEKISKKSFSDFLKQELFIPLGMKHTYTHRTVDFFESNFSQGYTQSFKQVPHDRFDGVMGDKGIYTTTYDLFLLSSALYQNKLLSTQTQELAYAPHSPEKKLSNYGLGWRMKNMGTPEKEIFHNGWWHGYRTAFHRRLKDSLTIVILSNRLNKSVYATWRVYSAIDGPTATKDKQESDDE